MNDQPAQPPHDIPRETIDLQIADVLATVRYPANKDAIVDAARDAFRKLFVPGTVALLTNALGFMVIMRIRIDIVRELGITACLGVLLMIVTNKVFLPILLFAVAASARLVWLGRAAR